ncbi:signal transduction histidine kinase [Streptosporangium becharense]|uniref:histidine kinase n=1 Tax=Streptosporangium becharense TaxID=1816182 RepID=A0A7W9II46_9ACTN|nr:ATP-binding protein [Streptosporangium becharense]MBB2913470.1 signal transduction histidine kinase [Streptosporangium becharense]MBB5821160.1 signal transduction histidine kinase [Streptosporangium becharense]
MTGDPGTAPTSGDAPAPGSGPATGGGPTSSTAPASGDAPAPGPAPATGSAPTSGLPPLPKPAPATGFGRLPVGRWFTIAGAGIALAFVIAAAVTISVIEQTRETRETVIDVIDPAALRILEISNALTSQESSVRAYGRTNDDASLRGYRDAVAAEAASLRALTGLLPRMPERETVTAEVARLHQAGESWRRDYAEKLIASVPTMKTDATNKQNAPVNAARFNEIRQSLAALQGHLNELHAMGGARLEHDWRVLYLALAGVAGVLLLAGAVAVVVVRYAVLNPLAQLSGQVRAVAQGDFDHVLKVERPAELAELSGHVDAMRHRMIAEWHRVADTQRKLEEQAAELRRSNGELEQFAYVASHDLQEPLRKVASFTQMLEQRYGEQLDDRARQYIAFAVDGAKRMQLLINDLLDFSRVGRIGGERSPIDATVPLKAALNNLQARIEEAGAEVTFDELPEVHGNRSQLTQLFQNLISNAIKFHSGEPPRVHIGVRRTGEMWEFSCTDNGIGIESKYTDRIFLIFQRLHGRDAYAGTGIGLALCKKIVEYHGGRIWVDTEAADGPGTTFRWTLPPGETNE